jgi:hypothetical protein
MGYKVCSTIGCRRLHTTLSLQLHQMAGKGARRGRQQTHRHAVNQSLQCDTAVVLGVSSPAEREHKQQPATPHCVFKPTRRPLAPRTRAITAVNFEAPSDICVCQFSSATRPPCTMPITALMSKLSTKLSDR